MKIKQKRMASATTPPTPTISHQFPRIFIARHGKTEWSENGRHTSISEIPLTEDGIKNVKITSENLVGEDKLIDPKNIAKCIISPRIRTKQTYDLLLGDHKKDISEDKLVFDEDVQEFKYGKYEGLKPKEIKALDPSFWIWTTGCPEGESAKDASDRADRVVDKIKKCHQECINELQNNPTAQAKDILILSHGHFTRVLIARFLGLPIDFGAKLVTNAGSIQVLGYQHKSLDEPSILALNLQ